MRRLEDTDRAGTKSFHSTQEFVDDEGLKPKKNRTSTYNQQRVSVQEQLDEGLGKTIHGVGKERLSEGEDNRKTRPTI